MAKIGNAIDSPQGHDYEVMVDARVYRLLEIGNQIDALRREQDRIVQSLLPDTEPELFFNDHLRRIYWDGGSVKLGKKSYLFVKTVWFGKEHQAEFAELEENVWMQRAESKTFVARRTVSTLVQHTQNNLTEVNFPYKIEALKNFSSRELEGFRLVLPDNHKKTCPLQSEEVV